MKADIKLSEKEVQEIVKNYIQQTTNHTVISIRFDINPGYNDPREYEPMALREAVVTVQLDANRR